MQVFDRKLIRARRERASIDAGAHDFLYREVALMLADRLLDINRGFPLALELGARQDILSKALTGKGGIKMLVAADAAAGMVRNQIFPVVADEELLPFRENAFDAVFSNLSLHWVNDLPGALIQIRRVLKPDGVFLAALFGGETLKELRLAMMEAELDVFGGMSPRISPFIDLRDMGALLQRAGFALPVVDFETLRVSYPDVNALMRDLKGMGETNAISARIRQGGSRRFFKKVLDFYPKDEDGRITATFEVVYAIGWSPHESQQKPLKPGAAEFRLAQALGTDEVGL